MAHAPCIYSEVPRGPRLGSGNPCCPRWQSHLPAQWRSQAVAPQSFRVFREYEVPARRVIGRDGSGQPCFCAYDYRLIEPRCDDDEEIYPAVTYAESVTAWRLCDGRWLVRRRVLPVGEDGDLIASLELAAGMPR